MLELVFTIIIIIETVYDLLMDKRHKKKSKVQLKKKQEIEMIKGTIKYIFIDPSKLKLLEDQKLGKLKKLGENIFEDQKLLRTQFGSKPSHDVRQSLKRRKKNNQKVKRIRKMRDIARLRRNKINKSIKLF